MRAVVDTNVLVSALLRCDSPPAAVVQAMVRQLLEPVVCNAIMAEYRAVLPRPRLRLRTADIEELLALIEAQAQWVDVAAYDGHPPLPDPSDWPFIASALAVGCPVITGNTRDFPARLGVRVISAREWVEAEASQSSIAALVRPHRDSIHTQPESHVHWAGFPDSDRCSHG